MNQLRISVAMCTCNGSSFVREQLHSIALQTRTPDELIICDDLSDDDTLSWATSFASKSSFPVRVSSNEVRRGPAANFGRAIEACNGDVIVLTDQDDVWRPDKLETLAGALEGDATAEYAFSDAEMVDEVGRPLGRRLWDAVHFRDDVADFAAGRQLERLLKNNFIPGAALAFRASLRNAILPIPAGWMHDYWIVLLGAVLSHGIPITQPLFYYRGHAAQVCGIGKRTILQACTDSLSAGPSEAWEKLEVFRELQRRVISLGPIDSTVKSRLELLEQKGKHLLSRANARSYKRLDRVFAVVPEAFSGRYHRFSNSWLSIVRDLWQHEL